MEDNSRIIELKNDVFIVTVQTLGAEIKGICDYRLRREFFVPGEQTGLPTILFPNLTAIKDGYILVDGKRYPLMHGGFAKTQNFSITEQTDTSVTLTLTENEETMAVFPYKFRLSVSYYLVGNTLTVSTDVTNTGTRDLYYALGFHPAYSCPVGDEPFTLYFDTPMTASRYIRAEKLFTTSIRERFFEHASGISLNPGVFEGGTLALTDLTCRKMRIVGAITGRTTVVDMGDYPNLALFAPADRPMEFLCIEVWDGAPDRDDTNHVWEEKPDLNFLHPGVTNTRTFSVSFE